MRTTVTLEPDVLRKVKALALRRGISFKSALDELIRRGLAAQARPQDRRRFAIKPHAGGFRPGVDPDKLNQLVDQLEAEDFATVTVRER